MTETCAICLANDGETFVEVCLNRHRLHAACTRDLCQTDVGKPCPICREDMTIRSVGYTGCRDAALLTDDQLVVFDAAVNVSILAQFADQMALRKSAQCYLSDVAQGVRARANSITIVSSSRLDETQEFHRIVGEALAVGFVAAGNNG